MDGYPQQDHHQQDYQQQEQEQQQEQQQPPPQQQQQPEQQQQKQPARHCCSVALAKTAFAFAVLNGCLLASFYASGTIYGENVLRMGWIGGTFNWYWFGNIQMVGFGCAIAAFIAIRACPARKTVILTLGGIGLGLCVISAGVHIYYILYLRCMTCRYEKVNRTPWEVILRGEKARERQLVETSCPGYCHDRKFIEKLRG